MLGFGQILFKADNGSWNLFLFQDCDWNCTMRFHGTPLGGVVCKGPGYNALRIIHA